MHRLDSFQQAGETSRINEVPSISDEMPVSSGTANDPTSTGHFWTTDSVPTVLSYTAVLVQAAVKAEKHRAFTDFKSFLYLGDPSGKCTISSSDSPSPGNPAYPQKVQLSGIFSFKKWHPSSSARPPRKYPELLCQQSIKSSTKVWNTEITGSKAFCWYLEFSV